MLRRFYLFYIVRKNELLFFRQKLTERILVFNLAKLDIFFDTIIFIEKN
jgi:hypothetical protein